MSNKTELQSNNIDLQGILDSINALPDAGSGGSDGSVETCTVTVGGVNKTSMNTVIAATIFDNGQIGYVFYDYRNLRDVTLPLTINNVICGSAISVTGKKILGQIMVSSNITRLSSGGTNTQICIAPLTANDIGSITYSED